MTMPGVGKITAMVILAEIGDIRPSITPRRCAIGQGWSLEFVRVIKHGHISKAGPPYLRVAMTRAATVASRTSKRWYRVHDSKWLYTVEARDSMRQEGC
ncbi:MAG: transposase [Anaerolineales bacterium]